MTVKIIAALPDTRDRSYDLYVKFFVYYPKTVKQYSTRIFEKSTGWTSIRGTVRFDEAPKDAPIEIQIWDHNLFKKDEQLYEENTTLSSMIDRVIFENSTMKSNSKLFIVSIWRVNPEYEFWIKFNEWMTNRKRKIMDESLKY